jgi:hypothetical protein
MGIVRVVAGASSYTLTAETGTPSLAAGTSGCSAIWDGTYLLIFNKDGANMINMVRRTAVNTYDALVSIMTPSSYGDLGGPAVFRQGTGADSDLVLFYRNNDTQANGEIYYIKRKAGAWDSSPGTRLAGNAATGWHHVSAAASDLDIFGSVRVVYMTGTSNPFTVIENGFNL